MTIAVIALGFLALVVAIIAVRDLTQREHAVTRNFPVIGHFRYWFEELGQPLRQYLFAGDLEERPYNRVTRSWVYASAKGQNNLVGFGSQVDHNQPGRMAILPSMYPTLTPPGTSEADLPRPRVIGAKRGQPYQPRRFANISGMSYGALSPNAVRALSRGARLSGCYMSTGEGSLSPYHVEGGGDILYQIGPAKFGCRTPDGRFDDEKAAAIMALPQVKMVEIKLAQGAKPGKGGMLPKEKITQEIAAIRGIPMGEDCYSPNRFEEFDDAPSLLDFIERVRKLTSKPVGLKMVVGSAAEVSALCREIRKRGDGPDFIAVDGNEGGSGAAPLALADYVGLPLVDALVAVDNGAASRGRARRCDADCLRQDCHGWRCRDPHCPGRRPRPHRTWLSVLNRLHPGVALPHQHVPDWRDDPESMAPIWAGSRGQGCARSQLRAGARAGPADDHARLRSHASQSASPRARRREHLAWREEVSRRALPLPVAAGQPNAHDRQD